MLYFVHCRFPQLCSLGIIISRQDAGSDDGPFPSVAFEFRKQHTVSFPFTMPSTHPGNVAEINQNYKGIIILSYAKVFPEQNNLLRFQTRMCRNYNFLCGQQLASSKGVRGIMPRMILLLKCSPEARREPLGAHRVADPAVLTGGAAAALGPAPSPPRPGSEVGTPWEPWSLC